MCIRDRSRKYETTYNELETQINETESQLCSMIDDLEGDEFDMKGLSALKALLQGCLLYTSQQERIVCFPLWCKSKPVISWIMLLT